MNKKSKTVFTVVALLVAYYFTGHQLVQADFTGSSLFPVAEASVYLAAR